MAKIKRWKEVHLDLEDKKRQKKLKKKAKKLKEVWKGVAKTKMEKSLERSGEDQKMERSWSPEDKK